MRISRSAVGKGIASSVFLSLSALFALSVMGTRDDFLSSWRRISPWVLAGGGAVVALAWLARVARMWLIARAMDSGASFGRLLGIHFIASFAAHITPFSGGGVPMQVYLIHRTGMPLGAAAALTAVEIGANSLVVLIALAAVLLWNPRGLSCRLPVWFWWMLAALGALILAGLVWRIRQRGGGGDRLSSWWRREFGLFRQGLGAVIHKGVRPVLLIMAATLAQWFFYLLLAPVILAGLGLDVSWGLALGAQLVFNLLHYLLPTPGGSGGSEVLLRVLFAPMLDHGQAAVFVSAWKLFTFYATLLPGGILFWRRFLRRKEPEPPAAVN